MGQNSNTPRHLAEFWMLEPEVAFADLEDLMDLAEACVRESVAAAEAERGEELAFLQRHVDQGLGARLAATQRERSRVW